MSILINHRTIWTPDNSYLLKYRAEAEAGDILIGQELWTELDNLAEDMTLDRYIYDRSDALLRMDFMENCVRLTKSPFYNKPMVLMLWQKALIEAFYSFKMADTELDRFKKLLLLIARKNTKSETSSALAEAEFIVGSPGADIVASSNDDAQASIVYDAIDTMRQLIDPNDLDTKRNQRFILNKTTNTKIFKLSSRTKNKEGRNINFAIVDEVHEMKDNTIGKSIEQSQSLKENPKFIIITTEGFVIDGYLDDELIRARAIINKEADDPASERLLPWLYTQDSESEVWNGNRHNRLWMKSNPTLGTVKKWDYLEEQVALARQSKSDRIFVLSKDFNIKQNAAESWLNLEDYNYECRYSLEDFRGSFALGSVDLAETTDLVSAKVLLMKPNDPRKYIVSHYFIPENKLIEADDKIAGAHYKAWAEEGLMTITEGADVDLAIVADWFYSLYERVNIKLWKCGYDQRFSKDWLKRMEYYGWFKTGNDESSDVIMINQNAQTLTNAIKLTESDFKHKLIYYNNHEVDKWCFGNAGLKVDNNGSLIVKLETKKRIDGAVSLAILYEMYRRYRTDFKTIVEREA
jgi:phage terminase large subunit-like protein